MEIKQRANVDRKHIAYQRLETLDAEARLILLRCTELGDQYYNGYGTPAEDKEAFRWYRIAADQGYAAAQSKLGGCIPTEETCPRTTRRPRAGSV